MTKQFAPRIIVLLYEVVSGGSVYDVTEWLGDSCTIQTSKGVLEPFGTFTITFLDKEHPKDGGYSLYARAAPMDGIEIRAAHDGSKDTQCLMRGFISSIRRDEAMTAQGPQRRVTIIGQDVGKLWVTQMLHFLPIATDAAKILTGYGLFAKYCGPTAKNMSGTDFLGKMVDVLDGQLQLMLAGSAMSMSLTPAGEGEGTVPVQRIHQQIDISFYNFMSNMLDRGHFYELWMDDPGSGPIKVRWRELWNGDGGITITNDDVASGSAWRDDSRVSNWFWCWPTAGALISQEMAQIDAYAVAQESMDARDYKWCKEQFYGWRKLEAHFSLLPPDWATNADNPPKDAYISGKVPMQRWIEAKNWQLQMLNRDNGKLEHCRLRISGNEDAKAGTWMTWQKGGASFVFYATRVSHEITLWQSFTTTVEGQRGQVWSGEGTYRPELDLKGTQK